MPGEDAGCAASSIASHTNGKEVPSFIPPSAVRVNFTVSLSSSLGGPTWTSDARTGSVGATTAASNNADGTSMPIQYHAAKAVTAIHVSIPTLTSRSGIAHFLNEKRWS